MMNGIVYFDILMKREECPELHRHEFHEFFFNYEEGGEQLTAGGRRPMRRHDLYCFPAGYEHIGNGDCHGGVLYVGVETVLPRATNENEAAAVLNWLSERAEKGQYIVPLSSAGRTATAAIFSRFLEEFRRGGYGTTLAWRILTLQQLLLILRDCNLERIGKLALPHLNADERIRHACVYLGENYTRSITVETAARIAGMSRSHFLSVFRRVTGSTFTEYLNRLRCQRAIELLHRNELPLSQIANASGFSSVSNYYRAFRAEIKRRPADYRPAN